MLFWYEYEIIIYKSTMDIRIKFHVIQVERVEYCYDLFSEHEQNLIR